eukprot:28693-Pelagococcus_subviridis.AAC.3
MQSNVPTFMRHRRGDVRLRDASEARAKWSGRHHETPFWVSRSHQCDESAAVAGCWLRRRGRSESAQQRDEARPGSQSRTRVRPGSQSRALATREQGREALGARRSSLPRRAPSLATVARQLEGDVAPLAARIKRVVGARKGTRS